jgi:hypothetical protein
VHTQWVYPAVSCNQNNLLICGLGHLHIPSILKKIQAQPIYNSIIIFETVIAYSLPPPTNTSPNFGVIKFAVSKFIFELLWFGLVFVGGGREYAITVSKIIIEL